VDGHRVEVKKELDFSLLYYVSCTLVGGDRVEVG